MPVVQARFGKDAARRVSELGEEEQPKPGEVIFADAARWVHARRWTFRQSKHSAVGNGTRRALIVSEGLRQTAAADVAALLDTLATEVPNRSTPAGWSTAYSPRRRRPRPQRRDAGTQDALPKRGTDRSGL